jgi:uncharacterized protein (DUF58 family)
VSSGEGRPVPTQRAVTLLLLAVPLWIFRLRYPALTSWAVGWDVLCLCLLIVDYLRAPKAREATFARLVPPLFAAGVPANVRYTVERAQQGAREPAELQGELKDVVPEGLTPKGHHQRFLLPPRGRGVELQGTLTPTRRGDFTLGDLHVRLLGPFGLMQRQLQVPAQALIKVFPDIRLLDRDVGLATGDKADAKRTLRRRGQGREFDSLRDWRLGDDPRHLDWKATARRGAPTVRVHRPERNQTVLVFLDCGRHMAGNMDGRLKLDFAVDAALRLCRASVSFGDRMGLVSFAQRVLSYVPPDKGDGQIRRFCHALYRAEARLEESDYGAAFDQVFPRTKPRSLVIVLTDLLDAPSAKRLNARVGKLRPRHLPLLVSLRDHEVDKLASAVPRTAKDAYMREAAQRLEDEVRATLGELRGRGARVVRAHAAQISSAALGAYVDIKGSGAL